MFNIQSNSRYWQSQLIIVKTQMVEFIQTKFNVYMEAKGRVEVQLESLAHWIICTKFYQPLIKLTCFPLIWKHYFKLLILLNKLLMDDKFNPGIAEAVLQKMRIYSKRFDKFEQTLMKKLFMPYKLYLQKRCAVVSEGDSEDSEAKLFQILNLINLGSSFTEMLFVLGRYYQEKVRFAVDFNVVLAQDLNQLYNKLADLVSKCPHLNPRDDLEKTHQKLYSVFYNCYFHRTTRKYAPKWIKTDDQFENLTPKKLPKLKQKKHSLYVPLKAKCRENTEKESPYGFSTKASLTNDVDPEQSVNTILEQNLISEFELNAQESKIEVRASQKQRLQLLKSLERVMEEIQ